MNYTRLAIDTKCCAISCFSKSALGLVLRGVCLFLFDAMIAAAISEPKASEQISRTNSYYAVVFKIFPSAQSVYSFVQSAYRSVQSVYSSVQSVQCVHLLFHFTVRSFTIPFYLFQPACLYLEIMGMILTKNTG